MSSNHWERVVEDGKTLKALKTKKGNYKVMLEEFVSDVLSPVQGTTFPEHLFIGQWQQRQFNEMKTNLPEDCVMLVMDFDTNRLIRFQNETKSIYYTIQLVTIHHVVVFYRSLDITDLTVRESLVFHSDDHSHDHIAVKRGSYMSAHVLLNLLNELGKRDKMRGLPSILSLFRNEFNKFNNTRARMLDSIYHMTLRLL